MWTCRGRDSFVAFALAGAGVSKIICARTCCTRKTRVGTFTSSFVSVEE